MCCISTYCSYSQLPRDIQQICCNSIHPCRALAVLSGHCNIYICCYSSLCAEPQPPSSTSCHLPHQYPPPLSHLIRPPPSHISLCLNHLLWPPPSHLSLHLIHLLCRAGGSNANVIRPISKRGVWGSSPEKKLKTLLFYATWWYLRGNWVVKTLN